MLIAANRFTGARCGLGVDVEMVRKGRCDDDINCLSIPADYIDLEQAKKLVDVFLAEKFSEEEKYRRRLYKLEMLGGSCCGGGCGNC
jgi:ribose 5-phosphate isomerase B